MPLRSRAMVPSTASRVVIRVEHYEADHMAGLLYNPYLDKIDTFNDVLQLTNKLDEMFDQMSFPQANMSYRSFNVRGKGKKAGPAQPATAPVPSKGVQTRMLDTVRRLDKDVFLVHVQFRQNADWQGTVKWAGVDEEKRFRSMLELLMIMDTALQENHPPAEEDTPAE